MSSIYYHIDYHQYAIIKGSYLKQSLFIDDALNKYMLIKESLIYLSTVYLGIKDLIPRLVEPWTYNVNPENTIRSSTKAISDIVEPITTLNVVPFDESRGLYRDVNNNFIIREVNGEERYQLLGIFNDVMGKILAPSQTELSHAISIGLEYRIRI